MSHRYFEKSDHTKLYSKVRPIPPESLNNRILELLNRTSPSDQREGVYVDVGCGNGQATFGLAPFFKEVHAFDISPSMIQEAKDEAVRRGQAFEHVQFR